MFKMGKIICGFSGIGKTFADKNSNGEILDLESSPFSWIYYDNGLKERNPDFPKNYIDKLELIMSAHPEIKYILLSCHQEVRDELKRRGLKYIIVRPLSESKNEYLKRWLTRDETDMDFLHKMNDNWIEMLSSCCNDNSPKVYLEENEYLSDILLYVPRYTCE